MMVTEAEAIKRVQMPAGDESERMVGKARGAFELATVGLLKDRRIGIATKDNPLADFSMETSDVVLMKPRTMVVYPAPWCPKPWSKSSRTWKWCVTAQRFE